MSLLYWDAQNCNQQSRCVSAMLSRGGITSLKVLATFLLMQLFCDTRANIWLMDNPVTKREHVHGSISDQMQNVSSGPIFCGKDSLDDISYLPV